MDATGGLRPHPDTPRGQTCAMNVAGYITRGPERALGLVEPLLVCVDEQAAESVDEQEVAFPVRQRRRQLDGGIEEAAGAARRHCRHADLELGFWVWPLPAPGPLGFVYEWPAEEIQLMRTQIDGGEILTAAPRAEELWPDGDPSSVPVRGVRAG